MPGIGQQRQGVGGDAGHQLDHEDSSADGERKRQAGALLSRRRHAVIHGKEYAVDPRLRHLDRRSGMPYGS